MKKLATLCLFLIFCGSINSQTKIQFYNNTDKEIFVCYAYYNNTDQCWTSVGWWIVEGYGYKTIDVGNYRGSIYIRGRQGLLTEWGSGAGKFCVDADENFTIKFADTKDCWSKKSFSELKVATGVNKYTFQ